MLKQGEPNKTNYIITVKFYLVNKKYYMFFVVKKYVG